MLISYLPKVSGYASVSQAVQLAWFEAVLGTSISKQNTSTACIFMLFCAQLKSNGIKVVLFLIFHSLSLLP